MDRRWTNAALVLLFVVVNAWLVYALLSHQGSTQKEPSWAGSGGSGAVADATATPSASPEPSASVAAASASPSDGSATPAEGSATPTPRSSSATRLAAPRSGRLVLEQGPLVAAAFRPVAIRGVWKPAPAGTRATVTVEVRRGGRWSPFPLSAVVKASGRFTAYAALGPRGHYRVRVVASGGRPVSSAVDVTVG